MYLDAVKISKREDSTLADIVQIGAGEAALSSRLERVQVSGEVSLAVRVWEPDCGAALGPPFVLLHGIAATSMGWDEVAARLAGEGRAVYAIDFRGHGLSDRPEQGYDVATFASDLAAALKGLGLHRPILVGHSLGAWAILRALADDSVVAGGIGLVEGGLVDARDQFATIEEGLAKTALPPVAGMPLPRVAGYLRGSHPVWSEQRLAGALSAFDVNLDGTVAWRLTDARSEALFRSLWETSVADSWPAVHVPAVVAVADTGDAHWTAAKRAAEPEIRRAIPDVRMEWFTAEHELHADLPQEIADLLLDVFAATR